MMNKLTKIYQILLKAYGKQGWWPTTLKGKFVPEYSGGPKSEQQQLEIIFGALLTQNSFSLWQKIKGQKLSVA